MKNVSIRKIGLSCCIVMLVLGCIDKRVDTAFVPPPMDFAHGILISLDKEDGNLSDYVPASFVQVIRELAKSVSNNRKNAYALSLHSPDSDSLFRYYQRKFFTESVFGRCYGYWPDSILERNIHIFDSMFSKTLADSAIVFNDSSFNKNYEEYLQAIIEFSEEWNSIFSTNTRISSIHFHNNGKNLLSVYSSGSLDDSDSGILGNFFDMFIIIYTVNVIPQNYETRIRNEACIYFRYFENTIHVMFPAYFEDLDCHYDITMIIDQPCILERKE